MNLLIAFNIHCWLKWWNWVVVESFSHHSPTHIQHTPHFTCIYLFILDNKFILFFYYLFQSFNTLATCGVHWSCRVIQSTNHYSFLLNLHTAQCQLSQHAWRVPLRLCFQLVNIKRANKSNSNSYHLINFII